MFKENIFLGLGSNKGERINYLIQAVSKVNEDSLSEIISCSSVYESEPYGSKKQSDFLNAVIKIKTGRRLDEFCPWIKSLEREIGRTPSVKWGPREIDIDVLFYDNVIYDDGKLIVPHKEITLRDFVLVPLKEIAPDFEHPVLKKKISEIDDHAIEKLIIRKLDVSLLREANV